MWGFLNYKYNKNIIIIVPFILSLFQEEVQFDVDVSMWWISMQKIKFL